MREKTTKRDKKEKKLRIFCAAFDLAKDTPFYPIFGQNLYSGLKEITNDLIKFKWDLPYLVSPKIAKAWRKNEKPIKNKQLVKEVQIAHEKKKIDLFISAANIRYIYPETIEKIKEFGIPTLNFATDDVINFTEICKDLAKVYDYNWTGMINAVKNYKKIGAKFIYAPHGADPHIYKPYNCNREFDVTFVGKERGYRKKVLQTLVDEGIDIQVYGGEWRTKIWEIPREIGNDLRFLCRYRDLQDPKERMNVLSDIFWSDLVWHITHFDRIEKIFHHTLSYEEKVKMYSRSKVTISFSGTCGPYEKNFYKAVKTFKGKDVEVPMSGAFYLTEHSNEIAQLYEIGKEIETYRSISELVDKIKYYLENPDEAEAIRKAGRQRALKDYTWKKCLERVFKETGLL